MCVYICEYLISIVLTDALLFLDVWGGYFYKHMFTKRTHGQYLTHKLLDIPIPNTYVCVL